MNKEAEDRAEIRELIANWVIWRDTNRWDRFRTIWHDDGKMVASWRQASVDEFVKGSQQGFAAGVRIVHQLGGSSVDVVADRAISETKVTISQRATVHGVSADVVCMARHYDFWDRREGRWGLVLRESIYEKDWMQPVEAGTVLSLDPARLAEYPEGYRHLAYLQREVGWDVKKDMPCVTGAALEGLYRRGAAWLDGSAGRPEEER